MATITKTFGEYLKDYLKTSLETSLASYMLGYTIRFTNDLTTYLSGSKSLKLDETLCIISTGNATRSKTDTVTFYSMSQNLYFVVPLNIRENFMRILESWALSESDEDTPKSLGAAYYATFNYNTPSCDGVVHALNGTQVVQVVLMATVNYMDTAFGKVDIPYISIGGSQLINVRDFTPQASQNIESKQESGALYQTRYVEGETRTYTITVLVDKSNALHLTLLKTAVGYDTVYTTNVPAAVVRSLTQTVLFASTTPSATGTYEQVTFSGHLQISPPISVAGFTTMTITVVR